LSRLSRGDGDAELVSNRPPARPRANLERLLNDPGAETLSFARFDLGILGLTFGAVPAPCYCTKIAFQTGAHYTDRHGLKELTPRTARVEISKQQTVLATGAAETLSEAPARLMPPRTCLHLHELKARLDVMLAREGATPSPPPSFDFLPGARFGSISRHGRYGYFRAYVTRLEFAHGARV